MTPPLSKGSLLTMPALLVPSRMKFCELYVRVIVAPAAQGDGCIIVTVKVAGVPTMSFVIGTRGPAAPTAGTVESVRSFG